MDYILTIKTEGGPEIDVLRLPVHSSVLHRVIAAVAQLTEDPIIVMEPARGQAPRPA